MAIASAFVVSVTNAMAGLMALDAQLHDSPRLISLVRAERGGGARHRKPRVPAYRDCRGVEFQFRLVRRLLRWWGRGLGLGSLPCFGRSCCWSRHRHWWFGPSVDGPTTFGACALLIRDAGGCRIGAPTHGRSVLPEAEPSASPPKPALRASTASPHWPAPRGRQRKGEDRRPFLSSSRRAWRSWPPGRATWVDRALKNSRAAVWLAPRFPPDRH